MRAKSIIKSMALALMLLSAPAYGDEEEFQRWLADFRAEAASKGISENVLDEAFSGISENERVIELDRKQPESQMTLEEYQAKVLTQRRIDNGRERYLEHRALLDEIAKRYGVPAPYIVALWGMETSYGANTGSFDLPEALATLAYEGRRAAFFRKELMNVLTIMQQEGRSASRMTGSWAGAMGQCQFMPSSYLKYAVDYDGDGKRDIWESLPDVFASIAHYLASEGWNPQIGWQAGDGSETGNYKVLMRWNRSRYFVTSVGMLADQIGEIHEASR